jgi:hypothetical protein
MYIFQCRYRDFGTKNGGKSTLEPASSAQGPLLGIGLGKANWARRWILKFFGYLMITPEDRLRPPSIELLRPTVRVKLNPRRRQGKSGSDSWSRYDAYDSLSAYLIQGPPPQLVRFRPSPVSPGFGPRRFEC